MPREFPHLLDADIKVWRRFLASDANIYQRFDYDVRVGDGRDAGPNYPPEIRKMSLDLSKRRIDAVAHSRNDITIIELSVEAGLTQVGQLTAYPTLYRQTFKYTGTLKTLLVAQALKTDVLQVLLAQQIPYILIPE
jgi:hypothetical protein